MHKPPSLLELQHAFADSVLGDQYPLAACVQPQGLEPEQRLQVYRNMVANTCAGALHTSYPAVLMLVGEDFFASAAARYQQAYPSRSGNLQDYGEQFPVYLANMPEAAELPYLADVARLEWARQKAYLAVDSTPFDHNARIRAIGIAASSNSHLLLSPSLQLVCSQHRILDIWHFSQNSSPEGLTLKDGGQCVLVWRDGTQLAMQEIDKAANYFITALMAGDSVGRAYIKVVQDGADFEVQEFLGLLLHHQLICAIKECTI